MAVSADGGRYTDLIAIDLSSCDLAHSASLIRQACLDHGFFYVINHGIRQELFEELFDQSRNFFQLPLEEKMKALKNEDSKGYSPLMDQMLDPSKQTKGDCKEGYYIGVEMAKDDTRATKRFLGPNIWPSADILPGWRQTMEKYHQEALSVGRRVARLIALALNLEADFFDKPEILEEPTAMLRLLHYVDEISKPELGIYGAGAHSDFGLLTLLVTDDVSGLQICKKKDAELQIWEDVHPLRGAFIVNIGDMLERWTNGIFRWHISYNQVLTVWWSAFQLVIQRLILPSIFLSNLGIIWPNDSRTRVVTKVHLSRYELLDDLIGRYSAHSFLKSSKDKHGIGH